MIASKWTPLFNTNTELYAFDARHLMRSLEMVAFPGTLFEVIDQGEMLTVITEEYPSTKSLYTHPHFIVPGSKPRKKILPSKNELIKRLESFPYSIYIWGGNVPDGLPEMLSLYRPAAPLSPFQYACHQFKGIDCSGLLYYITNGFTPRNTTDLLNFGYEVNSVKPLDMLIWSGHVLIALPGQRLIECREFDGIVISTLPQRLPQIEHHTPKILRWY